MTTNDDDGGVYECICVCSVMCVYYILAVNATTPLVLHTVPCRVCVNVNKCVAYIPVAAAAAPPFNGTRPPQCLENALAIGARAVRALQSSRVPSIHKHTEMCVRCSYETVCI